MSQTDAQSGVEQAIERFFQLVSRRDMRVLEEFAPGDDILLVGSDEGEIARGRAAIEAFFIRIFARPSTFSWAAGRVDVSQSKGVAWFFAEGQMTVESAVGRDGRPYRISGVLEEKGDRWLWKQYHGSEPVPTG